MEIDMIFRLSILVGFLTAGFLALSIAVLMLILRGWHQSSVQELNQLLDESSEEKR